MATRWDRASREAGVVKGLDQWKRRLDTYKSELEESDQEWRRARAPEVGSLLQFVEDLSEALADHPDRAAWSEHLAALARLLRTYIVDPSPILDALDGLGRFDALGSEVGHEQFIATVRAAIENLRSDEALGQHPAPSRAAASTSSTSTRSSTFASGRSRSSASPSAHSPPPRALIRSSLMTSERG